MKPPSINPCGSCPYRRDVPGGIWAREEYLKLPDYDLETGSQPVGVFMCHQQNGTVCAGWAGTHDMAHNLAVRFACSRESESTIAAILDYSTDTPLFSSGREACDHGLKDLKSPKPKAIRTVARLIRKRKTAGSPSPQGKA